MLKIEQHHSGWRVLRDGDPVADAECPSGSHPGFQAAVRQAIRIREEGERIESRTWHKRHDNGWLSRLTVTADGRIEWGSHDGPAWSIQLTPADDIGEAERRADEAANRQSRHSCSEQCGRWWLSS